MYSKKFFLTFILFLVTLSAIDGRAGLPAQSCQWLFKPSFGQFQRRLVQLWNGLANAKEVRGPESVADYQKLIQMEVQHVPLYFLSELLSSNDVPDSKGNFTSRVRNKIYEAMAKGVLLHPTSPEGRAEFLRSHLSVRKRFPFYDEVLGLDHFALEEREKIESLVSSKDQVVRDTLGIGEAHSFWFTAHHELYEQINLARRSGKNQIVDLGCGTGRLGLLLGLLYPTAKFIGLDLYSPRVLAAQAAAQKLNIADRVTFKTQDLLDLETEIPKGDFYYIYGPTTSREINRRVVERLKPSKNSPVFFISSKLRDTNEILFRTPWLRNVHLDYYHPTLVFSNF